MARPRVRQDKKSGKWIVEYYHEKKQHRIKGFLTRKAAEAKASEIDSEARKGMHTPTSASGTVEDACRDWVQRARDLKLEKSTIRQYENHTELHIIPLTHTPKDGEKPAWSGKLGDLKLAKLTAPIAYAVQREWVRRLSPALARKVMVSFKAVIDEAVNNGRVAYNAASSVKPERQDRTKTKIWPGVDFPNREEVAAVVLMIEGRWRPFILVLAFCGLRASEARGLEWIDVLGLDTQYPQLRVRQRADMDCEIGNTKTSAAERMVPIPPTVATALREWKKVCPVDGETGCLRFVFPNGNGNVENHANLYNRGWDAWQIKAGVCEPKRDKEGKVVREKNGGIVMTGKYGVHALRHFYASVLIDDGFNPKRVQTLLGHSTIQVTLDYYSHLFPPDQAEDQARFARMEDAVLAAAK